MCDMTLVFITPSFASDDALFYIDKDNILLIATTSVYEAKSDIPLDDLVPEQEIQIFCDFKTAEENFTNLGEEIDPCVVVVYVAIKSSFAEHYYMNEDGICLVADQYRRIVIHVKSDGSASVKHTEKLGTGSTQTVECTEEFFELSR